MYKQNMYEFVEKVSEFVEKHYGKKCMLDTFRCCINLDDVLYRRKKAQFKKILVFYVQHSESSYHGNEVTDSWDFEERVYEILKDALEETRILSKLPYSKHYYKGRK